MLAHAPSPNMASSNHPGPWMKTVGIVWETNSFRTGDCSGDCCVSQEIYFAFLKYNNHPNNNPA
jgi:hypothetical protein